LSPAWTGGKEGEAIDDGGDDADNKVGYPNRHYSEGRRGGVVYFIT